MAPTADWSGWERDGLAPRSHDGYGLHEDHADDAAQFVALGCNAWRMTVEWARIEPEPGRIDNDALDRYRDILAAARSAGLENWVTLQHTSLPGWYVDDEGGHRDARARGRFWARHVDRIAEALDEYVDGFVPIDDPIGWAVRGYGLGTRPPGGRDPRRLREAVEGAVLATHEAVRLLASGDQPIMTAWRADPVHAMNQDDGRVDPQARQATSGWDDLMWGTWLRSHADGMLEIDGRAPIAVPEFVGSVDIVGIVHDHPVGVTAEGGFTPWPARARTDASGFAPEPDELAEAIHRTIEALPDHAVAVAAHGTATDDDSWQDHLLARGLDHVLEAAAEHRLVGYFHDAGIDGYEWTMGFTARRGLLARDRSRRRCAASFAAASS